MDATDLGLEIGEIYLIKNSFGLPHVPTWSESFNEFVNGMVVEFLGGIKVKLIMPSESSKGLLKLGLQHSYRQHSTPGEVLELIFNEHLVFTKL